MAPELKEGNIIPLEMVKSRVVIIGAGASGLQCANQLVTQYGYHPNDIIILEARDRIGGRIHSTHEVRRTTCTFGVDNRDDDHKSYTEQQQQSYKEFTLDHGAAWVHGTGIDWGVPMDQYNDIAKPYPNPVMELLQQEVTMSAAKVPMPCDYKDDCINHDKSVEETETIYTKHLRDVGIHGNPWARPQTILHKANQIVLYVDGKQIDNESSDIKLALQQHFTIFQKIANLQKDQSVVLSEQTSLQDMINFVQQPNRSFESYNDDVIIDTAHNHKFHDKQHHNVVQSLRLFYQHLRECWYGASSSDLQVAEFIDDTINDEIDDNIFIEESKSSFNGVNVDSTKTGVYDEEYKEDFDFYGPHCTIKTGMKSVLLPLLQNGISERIMLNQEVTKVRLLQEDNEGCIGAGDSSNSTKRCISITTSSGLEVFADCCVMTIPPSCIQQNLRNDNMFFEPQLRHEKIDAIRRIHMSAYKKVFLTFDRIFWPKHPAFIGLISHKSSSNKSDDVMSEEKAEQRDDESPIGDLLLLDNLWARDDIPCIEAILFGKSGEWAVGRSDDEIQNVVLDFIFDAMGIVDDSILQNSCIGCHITRWEEDKYSSGAFSAMAVGTNIEHIHELNCPEYDGSLIFAGEATISDRYEGCVYSALFSGKDAAAKVQDYYDT